MDIEYGVGKVFCTRCGMAYSKRRNFFPVSYAKLHKGIGYTPVCRKCIDQMFREYLDEFGDTALAARQICRKLDLYYDDRLFELVSNKATPNNVMFQYLYRLTMSTYAGKSYDDTLINENGTIDPRKDSLTKLYVNNTEEESDESEEQVEPVEPEPEPEPEVDEAEEEQVSEDVISFWGKGYTPEMYRRLEQRWAYWSSKYPEGEELDVGTEVILRQICSLELDINRDRAAGRPVDKSVNTLNTLLGSLNLKPVQKKDDLDSSINNTPLGVWLYRFENKRPLPDNYPDSPILKYIFTWMGHLCKMLGVKGNKYTQLYEEAIRRNTVEKPEYEGDEDDLEDQFLEFLEDSPSYNDA